MQRAVPAAHLHKNRKEIFMKILVLQYEMMEDGGYVLPTHMGGTVDI